MSQCGLSSAGGRWSTGNIKVEHTDLNLGRWVDSVGRRAGNRLCMDTGINRAPHPLTAARRDSPFGSDVVGLDSIAVPVIKDDLAAQILNSIRKLIVNCKGIATTCGVSPKYLATRKLPVS